MIKVGNHYFELLTSYKDGFNEDDFIARYSEILDKYDFVVGDYGYDQLRLKGFYHDSYKKQILTNAFQRYKIISMNIVILDVPTLSYVDFQKQKSNNN